MPQHRAPSRRSNDGPRATSPARPRVTARRRRSSRQPFAFLGALVLTTMVLTLSHVYGAPTPTGSGTAAEMSPSWAASQRSAAAHERRDRRDTSRSQRSQAPGPTRSQQEAMDVTDAATPADTIDTNGGDGTSSSTQPTSQTPAVASASWSPTGGPYVAYSADSFFRSPLPTDTPVSPDSADIVAHAKANEPFPYLKIRGAHGVGWGIAYAMADCADPIYRIGTGGNLPTSQLHLRVTGFHAPASVWQNIPPNGDAPFLVIDTCGTAARPAGLSVWGAGAAVSGQTVNTTSAGSFSHDSNGLDRRNPLTDSTLNERSRGVIPDSMAIRLDLLEHAIRNNTGLGHVLEVFWMETDSAAGFASPMVGAESGKSGVGAEGQRFRIRADVDLSSRPGCNPQTNPVGLAIARTLQQHGAYLGDNSGSGSGVKTEQNADFPGLNADSLRGCMTWDDIEFLPLGYDG